MTEPTDCRTLFGLYPCGCVSLGHVEDPRHPKDLGEFHLAARGLRVVAVPPGGPQPPWHCPDPAACVAPAGVKRLRRAIAEGGAP